MIKSFLGVCLKCGTLGLIAFLLLGWGQNLHPAFDSFSHFRHHFTALLIAFVVLFAIAKRYKWAITGLVVAVISLVITMPYLPGLEVHSKSGDETTYLRVVQMNLRFNNTTPERATKVIRGAEPDIILLQEVTLITEGVVEDFAISHPFQLSCQKRGVGSVAIISRYPFINSPINKCARFFGYASALIEIDGRAISLASFHSRWPWPRNQAGQVAQLKQDFENLPSPLILAGDFNSAPWSAVVQKIANWSNTRVVEGLLLTWAPRFIEFKSTIGPLLPLDQTLISHQFKVKSRHLLEDGGSDHFPILTVLSLS